MNNWELPRRQSLAFALATPVAWLVPPFVIGIGLSVLGLLDSEASNLPVEMSLAWGYMGLIAVPLIAFGVARAGHMSTASSVGVVVLAAISYVLGSFAAMAGIVMIEFSLHPMNFD